MSFLKELQRRNVIRMALLYIVASWLLLQVTDVLSSLLPVPDWTGSLVFILLAIGFPLVLIFSWIYELTPEGVKREKEVDRSRSITPETGRKINILIVVLLVLAIAGLALDRFIPEKAPVAGTATEKEKGVAEPRVATSDPTELVAEKFASPPDRSIAVLPFVNMSGDEENEYFSDGLTEELLNVLAQIKDLQVAGRTSSFAFKGKEEDLRVIGEKLSVAHILEGSVRKAGNRVRVTAQLIKSDDGYHMWSQTYDRELDDVFAIQEDIAEQVVDALKITLLGEDTARLSRRPTDSAEAHDAYLLGRHELHRNSYESLAEAVIRFKEAVRLDPDYAEAWAALAEAYMRSAKTGSMPLDQAVTLAANALDQATEANPDSAEAYAMLGRLSLLQQENEAAGEYFAKALSLQPNNPEVLTGFAGLMVRRGDAPAALEYNWKALELDPLRADILWQRAGILNNLHRYDEAMAQYERMREVDPDAPNGYYGPANVYYHDLGRLDRAAEWYARSSEVDPSDYELPALAAMCFIHLEALDAALPWIERANQVGPGQSMPHVARMTRYRRAGQDEEALAMAREYIAKGMDERQEDYWAVLRLLRDNGLETGDYDEALAAYRAAVPQFFRYPIEDAAYRNYIGVDLVPLLIRSGQEEQATRLAEALLAEMRRRDPAMLQPYFRLNQIWLHTYTGQLDEAVEALRLYVEEGERASWWTLEIDPAAEALRERAEYPALLAAIKADIAQQRARLMEMKLTP
ncbi:MAG: tetratricopeptide repeat protein [Gammaproteobacteria bacterium]|jgi:TolB-like protein/Tfp pilus assembly protein PilF